MLTFLDETRRCPSTPFNIRLYVYTHLVSYVSISLNDVSKTNCSPSQKSPRRQRRSGHKRRMRKSKVPSYVCMYDASSQAPPSTPLLRARGVEGREEGD
jgi:hypothetical protein